MNSLPDPPVLNFLETILASARRVGDRPLTIEIHGKERRPTTGAELLADVTAHALRHLQACPQDGGLYHCVAAGETNWNLYAKEVLAQVALAQPAIKLKATEVAPVPTSAFPTPAARPHNSRLDTTRLQNTFGITLPPWQQGVARMLREIL